jgi:hypothetical protein
VINIKKMMIFMLQTRPDRACSHQLQLMGREILAADLFVKHLKMKRW